MLYKIDPTKWGGNPTFTRDYITYCVCFNYVHKNEDGIFIDDNGRTVYLILSSDRGVELYETD